jgi:prepilin-type N-terminal cleavage/methylation domain-containing protein
MCERIERRRAPARSGGFTFTEVLVVLVLMGLTATVTGAAWERAMSRAATMQAARLVQQSLLEARMLAVYRGLNHFVVVNPEARSVELWEDCGTPFGALDPQDRRVAASNWPEAVDLALPEGAPSLPHPLGGPDVTRAWFLPRAQDEGWTGSPESLLATPQGALASVADPPVVVPSGAIVFSNGRGETVSLGLRGQFGSVRWFRWTDGAWKRG